ncbi:MAG TPA: non-ribosomal peptide synthetase [Pyrinomonadaceae bacterium]|nr:non-ribosomal peptide synthetase [Pyrinomonadaceae bacterium]
MAPHAAAIVSTTGAAMTYGDLDRRANQMAHHLIGLGVKAESVVAVCLNRSAESVLAALAVMKAGGAYLPIDPKQPRERLAFMLSDAEASAVIADPNLADELAGIASNVIDISDRACDRFSSQAPVIPKSQDQLAYVIYTSGSTGEPKGVEVTHANLANLIDWHVQAFDVTSADRASHLSNVSFDAAVWEVWPYLAKGAALYLPDNETRVSPISLRDWFMANDITISFVPTPLAESLMALPWPDKNSLRFLLTGADTLHRYPTRGLSFTLVNNYGPTECTVVTTSGRIDSRALGNDRPTIGRAITNASVYILDKNFRQVARGKAGELCVGGACVSRGYRNRPELTAEKFIPDQFGTDPSARLYRTGDLARELENGEIAYLGRIDEQIKILGHRIEPAEIEAAIDRHPAIASSIVVAHGGDCSDKRLAAYLTTTNCITPTAGELREFLRASLPDYMLPSLFVKIDALPVTANGKIDRNALPEPAIENTLRDEAFVAPQSPTEKRLAEIVRDLLHLTSVSVNDNFFLLGGHSLLGTQLIVKIRSAFSVDLSLRSLFDAPTIAELSREIERLIVARVESMSEEEALALLA